MYLVASSVLWSNFECEPVSRTDNNGKAMTNPSFNITITFEMATYVLSTFKLLRGVRHNKVYYKAWARARASGNHNANHAGDSTHRSTHVTLYYSDCCVLTIWISFKAICNKGAFLLFFFRKFSLLVKCACLCDHLVTNHRFDLIVHISFPLPLCPVDPISDIRFFISSISSTSWRETGNKEKRNVDKNHVTITCDER